MKPPSALFWKALIQRVHLWTGLVLGVQVLLWMASGVVMSWLPLSLVRGETNAYVVNAQPLDPMTYASPGGVIAQTEGATSVELKRLLDRVVYVAEGERGAALYDASSGERLSPLGEGFARRIARQDFIGDGEIVRASLISFPPQEYRSETPVWRVDFDDRLHTRIYVSPSTGAVKARRNDAWRFYDFFWMLHIMDYGERENFNNWFIRIAAAAGFVFALSGMMIVVLRLRRGRYGNDLLWVTSRRGKKRK